MTILDRCLQTSKPTAIALGLPIYAEHGESPGRYPTSFFGPSTQTLHHGPIPRQPGLSEWYQPVEPGTGLHPRPSSASALKAYFPEIDDSWSSVWYPTRKGESAPALHDRLGGFLTVLVPEVQRRFAGAHKRILLVTHAAVVIALARELAGDRGLSFRAACCSLSELDCKQDAAAAGDSARSTVVGGWTAKLLGDGGHLKDGLQRAWGFPDVAIADGKVSSVATANHLECDIEFILTLDLSVGCI